MSGKKKKWIKGPVSMNKYIEIVHSLRHSPNMTASKDSDRAC